MKYRIIYIDPPWAHSNYRDTKHGAAKSHYDCVPLEDMAGVIDVNGLAAKDSLMFMWVTQVGMAEGWHVQLMKDWGFKPTTIGFVWNKIYKSGKPYCGLGRYTRSAAEFCVIGKKGKGCKRQSASVYQVATEPVEKHSKKPAVFRDRIVELCGDLPRIEIFAREPAAGWSSWGNQLEVEA